MMGTSVKVDAGEALKIGFVDQIVDVIEDDEVIELLVVF